MYGIAIYYCLFVVCSAWLAPERCAEEKDSAKKSRKIRSPIEKAVTVRNISEIASDQAANLRDTYSNYTFISQPVRVGCIGPGINKCYGVPDAALSFNEGGRRQILPILRKKQLSEDDKQLIYDATRSMYGIIYTFNAYNCSFKTYDPRLLTAITCTTSICSLSYAVSTVDTYTASDGWNWGAKISAKLKIQDVAEIGAEASGGGTYSCAYTKGKTETQKLDCTNEEPGRIALYMVKTDMECDVGATRWELVRDQPVIKSYEIGEFVEIIKSGIPVDNQTTTLMLDTNKVPEYIKTKYCTDSQQCVFNWSTDEMTIIDLFGEIQTVLFKKYKKVSADKHYRKIIPFTNEHGDSVYEFACLRQPHTIKFT